MKRVRDAAETVPRSWTTSAIEETVFDRVQHRQGREALRD